MAALRAIALVIAALLAAPAHAQDRAEPVRLLDEARRLYRELEFLGAIEVSERVLARPDLSDVHRAEALEVLGSALVVLDRDAEARRAFARLFTLDPYYEVREPSGSPKIARFVARVRTELVPDAALDPDQRLEAELPRAGRVGQPTRLVLRASGDITTVQVFARPADATDWLTLAVSPLGAALFEAILPARGGPDEIELYALGRDARERVRARAGSVLAPLVLPVRLGGEGSIWEAPWLWTAIGGAVLIAVAVGVALGVASANRAPAGTLPPGRVELP